jgi:toxin HigB-1
MIKSFSDKRTAAIFSGLVVRGFSPQVQKRAREKLLMIDAALRLNDLRIPPGNRLEAMRGDRQGQSSIRINDQWRICFTWLSNEVWNVEIVDYH